METYFIISDGKKEGPFSLSKIIEMNLTETTLIWRPGIPNWIELKDLEDFQKLMPPPIPEFKPILEQDLILGNQNNCQEQSSKLNPESVEIKSSEKIRHAGFFLRLLAFILDFVVIFFITSFFWALLQIPIPSDATQFLNGSFFIFKNPLSLLFGWLYYSLFESSNLQATPGKLILKLKVTDIFNDKIQFGQATGRFFGKILSGLIIGIGYLMIGFTKDKQGLHDKLAKTYVVKGTPIFKNGKSISWIIFSIAFVLFIIALFIPSNTTLIDSSLKFKLNNSITNNAKSLQFTIEDVSFSYPEDWKITDNSELENGLGRNISLEKIGVNSSGVVTITWLVQEMELENGLEIMKNTIIENILFKKAIFTENQSTIINNKPALKTTYRVSILNVDHTGELITFILNGKTIFVLIQGADEDLNQNKNGFDLILNSIKSNA